MKRRELLLKRLLGGGGISTVGRLASDLQVCNRTIRNDLRALSELLPRYGLELRRESGRGVFIAGSDTGFAALLQELRRTDIPEVLFSPNERKNYILRRLLLAERPFPLKELMEELYCSRACINRELAKTGEWLEHFNLEIVSKPALGLVLRGREEDMRNALASLFDSIQRAPIALTGENLPARSFCFNSEIRRFPEDLSGDDFRRVERVISHFETACFFRFSDEALAALVMHIAIALKRIRSGKTIAFPPHVLEELRTRKEYSMAMLMSRELEAVFQVSIPETETGYILLHILGSRMQSRERNQALNAPGLGNTKENDSSDIALEIARGIIRTAEHVLQADLSADLCLLNSLVLHLIPTINRLRYGLSLKNPLLEQIRSEHPNLYRIASMSNDVFERFLNARVGEEEIAYIALHIGAALERARKPIRAWIVCSSGIGTSEYVAARLRNSFRGLEIADVLSIAELRHKSGDVDLIISTVTLETQLSVPVITISPLLKPTDIRLLNLVLDQIRKKQPLFSSITEEETFPGSQATVS